MSLFWGNYSVVLLMVRLHRRVLPKFRVRTSAKSPRLFKPKIRAVMSDYNGDNDEL